VTVAKATAHLHGTGCAAGKVTYAPSRAKKGLVISQDPKPFWQRQQGAVNLVVSKGKRG
jgi:beta-lactam-binding protein with PASTA domain